jgi:hypothetical protein
MCSLHTIPLSAIRLAETRSTAMQRTSYHRSIADCNAKQIGQLYQALGHPAHCNANYRKPEKERGVVEPKGIYIIIFIL